MIDHYRCIENTPSIHFNFEESNMKSDKFKEFISYEYSNTTNKYNEPEHIENNKFSTTITPLVKKQNNSKQQKSKQQKIDTEQFFDDFQNNFDIKFGDSPLKCQFSKHLDFNFDNNQSQKQNICQYLGNCSENIDPEKQEKLDNMDFVEQKSELKKKQKNKNEKNMKVQCQIRKRVLFKKNQSLAQKGRRKSKNKIINDENLMILTSGNWTGMPKEKKNYQGPFSQPIKAQQKKSQCVSHNIFSAHNGFRETLRSTTLNNWKKKHLSIKHKDMFNKKNYKQVHNLFERPFSLIR